MSAFYQLLLPMRCELNGGSLVFELAKGILNAGTKFCIRTQPHRSHDVYALFLSAVFTF